MPNRLAKETSPYLLQHKDNPIDWHPWGDEAFRLAAEQDKPVFLSVGYSSCHWCHVMAHESFEDPMVADALNRSFISIKLDREERPDIDEAYMTAVQVATGHGGWPMSVFMTPDKRPFFAGTYYPRDSRGQFPGFLTIVGSLATAWREDRAKLLEAADEFAGHLAQIMGRQMAPADELPDASLLDQCAGLLSKDFDQVNGGFGGAPKFPPHSAIRFLLIYASQRSVLPLGEDQDGVESLMAAAGHMALTTLQKIALGGIHDHVGGGFHRYATDAKWVLPHFEKMLSDNALLLWSFSRASQLAVDPVQKSLCHRAARGIVDWLKREMTAPSGVFYSALDADSEGEEGLFYTWTEDEVREVLGGQAAGFMAAFQFEMGGNFEDEAKRTKTGRNIPYLSEPADHSAHLDLLLAARSFRARPGLDDKALCSWNGLMVSGLAEAGEIDMASRCARAWLNQSVDGRLPHQITKGQAKGPALLEDYAFFIEGLVDLAGATGELEWSDHADRLIEEAAQLFGDPARGGFYSTSTDGEVLFGRTKPFFDGASPSANGVMLRALIKSFAWDEAMPHLAAALPWAKRMPHATETIHEAAMLSMVMSLMAAEEGYDLPQAPMPAPAVDLSDIRVMLTPREVKVDTKGWGHAILTISLPPGVHINTNDPPARWLTPTQLKVQGVLGEAGFPPGENDRYEGDVSIPVRLRGPGRTEEFELTVVFQPCTESECLLPVERSLTGVLLAE